MSVSQKEPKQKRDLRSTHRPLIVKGEVAAIKSTEPGLTVRRACSVFIPLENLPLHPSRKFPAKENIPSQYGRVCIYGDYDVVQGRAHLVKEVVPKKETSRLNESASAQGTVDETDLCSKTLLQESGSVPHDLRFSVNVDKDYHRGVAEGSPPFWSSCVVRAGVSTTSWFHRLRSSPHRSTLLLPPSSSRAL